MKLTLSSGEVLYYEVYKRVNVGPSELAGYIDSTASKKEQLSLVTCATERGKGWRFIAICRPLTDDSKKF